MLILFSEDAREEIIMVKRNTLIRLRDDFNHLVRFRGCSRRDSERKKERKED